MHYLFLFNFSHIIVHWRFPFFTLHPSNFSKVHNMPDYESDSRNNQKDWEIKTCYENDKVKKKMKCRPTISASITKSLSTDKKLIRGSCFWSDTWFTQHTVELQSPMKNCKGLGEKSWLSYLMSWEWGLRDKAGHERKWNVWEWQSPQSHLRTLTTGSCLPSLSNLLLLPSPLSLPDSFKDCVLCHLQPQNTVHIKDSCWNKQILQRISPSFYCIFFAFY